jgi:hypothetical protein
MGSCFSSSSSIPNTLEVESKYCPCDVCTITFSSEKKKLRDHRMSKHGGKFKCFKCKNIYETGAEMDAHMEENECSKN